MKLKFLILIALCAWTVSASDSDEEFDIPLSMEDVEDDLELLQKIESEKSDKDRLRENEMASKIALQYDPDFVASLLPEADPCEIMHCGAGRVCSRTGKTAKCICIPDCPVENDIRRNVCTNKNETWNSDCEVYKQRCLCDTKDAECKDVAYKHMHIDYYGPCKQVQNCSSEEMEDFPARMRDWLFNVMRDMAGRDELTEHYKEMEQEAENNLTRRWANAAIWKWCDLDGDTDRSVSRHELFPIRAPLVSLEHCIAPFLENCDRNNDHRISLKEWGRCLELEDDDLQERCDIIQKSNPHLLG